MYWYVSHRANPRANAVAKRHYNCQSPESNQFVPPGRCLVLLTKKADALWVTSFPQAEFVHHAWPGAFICSCFRNENRYDRKNRDGYLSSHLITEAVACTRWYAEYVWNVPMPTLGFITFVNAEKVKSVHPGECYRQAGWQEVGYTKVNHLLALQLLPQNMPEPMIPNNAQLSLFEIA